MKTVQAVVIFAILGVSLCAKFTEDMLVASDWECIKEIGIDAQTVLNSLNDDFTTTESDPKINDYTVCWYRKANAIGENDEIKFDTIKTIFTAYIEYVNNEITDKDQAASNAVEFCKTVEGDNLGDRLVKFGNCAINHIRAH